jgi:hypothetical protein
MDGRRTFRGCAYLADVADRAASAAVPLRLEMTERGWELTLLDDAGNGMVFDAREGRLVCDRFTLRMGAAADPAGT